MKDAVLDLISEELMVPRDSLTEKTRLDSLATDSIDLVSLIAALDTEFQLAIRPSDLERLVTVKDLVDYVDAHAGSMPSGTPDSF
jgi:acyl carrier protein